MHINNKKLIAIAFSLASLCIGAPVASAKTPQAEKGAMQCPPGMSAPAADNMSHAAGHEQFDAMFAHLVTQVITVNGTVKHPLVLRVDDLRKFPAKTVKDLTMTCLDGSNKGKMSGLKGALLRDILNKAELDAPGHNDVKRMYVVATASDGYKVVFSWAEIFNSRLGDGILVYYEKNHQPLGNDEGRIALVSDRDTKTGPRHVKWLRSLEVKKVD